MRSSFCVVCGTYTPYVALGEGTTTLFEQVAIFGKKTKEAPTPKGPEVHTRVATVRVVSGDPVCLGHAIRSSKHPNQFVRYARVEKLEPDVYEIDGVVKRT